MPRVETLRDFVNQRLTAAAEEIFGVFERTIAEYEELLCRCKEENERKQKLLDDVQLRFHRADNQEEGPSDQQEWSSSLDHEDAEPPQIKQEGLWGSQEKLKEFNTVKFPFARVTVKMEADNEKPQSSQLHKIQTQEMETGADGEDCGEPGQARNSEPERHLHPESQNKTGDCSEAETDDSDDWRVTVGIDSGSAANSKTFTRKHYLATHMRTHQKQKPFSCSECEKTFSQKSQLTTHMMVHTGQKPFSCPECDKKFSHKCHLISHMVIHTGEKPFSCELCKKKFSSYSQVKRHKCTGGQTP